MASDHGAVTMTKKAASILGAIRVLDLTKLQHRLEQQSAKLDVDSATVAHDIATKREQLGD